MEEDGIDVRFGPGTGAFGGVEVSLPGVGNGGGGGRIDFSSFLGSGKTSFVLTADGFGMGVFAFVEDGGGGISLEGVGGTGAEGVGAGCLVGAGITGGGGVEIFSFIGAGRGIPASFGMGTTLPDGIGVVSRMVVLRFISPAGSLTVKSFSASNILPSSTLNCTITLSFSCWGQIFQGRISMYPVVSNPLRQDRESSSFSTVQEESGFFSPSGKISTT